MRSGAWRAVGGVGLVLAAAVLWLLGWATHDSVLAAGGDWAAAIRNLASWAGDASKVALGALIGGAAGLAAGWANRNSARADRVREFRIEQIRETENVVSEQLLAVRHAMTSHSGLVLLWRCWRLQKTLHAKLQADLTLIGEIDAFVALQEATLVVGRKFPTGPLRWTWLGLRFTFHKPWNESDLAKVDTARTMCLEALRRQHERALRDEPLVTVSPEEARKRLDLVALEAAAARVSGK